ncbi:MAG TPA: copper transporter [Nocardioides sp.]
MISFRYHVVTIVAVFLALAVGVALGGGPLSELGRSSDEANARVSEENDKLTDDLKQAEQVSGFQDKFLNTTLPANLGSVLEGTAVAMVTMPGASSGTVKGLTEQIGRAQGTLVGTYAAQPGLVASDNKSLADTLGAQLAESVGDSDVPEGAGTYERLGALISQTIATPSPAGGPVDEDAKSILSSLKGADMFELSSQGSKRAGVVLVVLGSEPASDDGSDKLLSALLDGLSGGAETVVVAGSTASADTGILKTLRDDPDFVDSVSSVDSVQSRVGQVSAVYALGRTGSGETGHFGAKGSDGPLPRG